MECKTAKPSGFRVLQSSHNNSHTVHPTGHDSFPLLQLKKDKSNCSIVYSDNFGERKIPLSLKSDKVIIQYKFGSCL